MFVLQLYTIIIAKAVYTVHGGEYNLIAVKYDVRNFKYLISSSILIVM